MTDTLRFRNAQLNVARRAPLLVALLAFVIALLATIWTGLQAHAAADSAYRAWQDAFQARQAVLKIHAAQPELLRGDAGKAIGQLVDDALHASHASDRVLRSRSLRTIGSLGDTGISHSQAHLEFTGVTQSQSGQILVSLETVGLPITVDSASLTAGADNRWDLTVELGWYQDLANE